MNKTITYSLSIAILVVFGLYTIPHEFVHVFYDHNDTEHCEHETSDGPNVSAVHIHCDFLTFYETEFFAPNGKITIASTSSVYKNYISNSVTTASRSLDLRELRGPPVV